MNKRILIVTLFCLVLFGCHTLCIGQIWEETLERTDSVKSGIPASGEVIISYKRQGKEIMTVRLDSPVVVAMSAKPLGWGFFQFPNIYRRADGVLIASWNMADDAIASYGKGGVAYALSEDEGRTWKPARQPGTIGGVVLPNGDRIKVFTPKALKVDSLKLPKPIYSAKGSYGNIFTFYPMSELPGDLQGIYLQRLRKGNTVWNIEHNALLDSNVLRYSAQGLFPVVWWGDMRLTKDGSVIAGIYPSYRKGDNGSVLPGGIAFYRSTDYGHNWKFQGRIPYRIDLERDPKAAHDASISGFGEPAFDILADGALICVMRTTGGRGNRPMYISRSSDQGTTWSTPTPFTANGVLPQLLHLSNGVIALSSGRPGVQLRFCLDGKGQQWTNAFEMVPFKNEKDEVSCGYTAMLATGKNKFLLIYSDFKYPGKNNQIVKAIKVREVTVTTDQ